MSADRADGLELHLRFQQDWLAGRYAEAARLAELEMKAAETAGIRHPDHVRALLDLARVLRQKGEESASEQLIQQANQLLVELQENAAQSPDTLAAADLLLFLADRQWRLDADAEEVLSAYGRALDIRRRRLGSHHPDTAAAAAGLAEIHFLANRSDEAEPLFREAIAAYESLPAAKPLRYAQSLESVGQMLAELGRDAEAISFFERALNWADRFGRDKRPLYFLLFAYSATAARLGQRELAQKLQSRADRLLPSANPGAEGYHP